MRYVPLQLLLYGITGTVFITSNPKYNWKVNEFQTMCNQTLHNKENLTIII